MTEIIFLGTSGYVPTPERDNAAFLLKTGESSILVDCPGSPLRKLAAAAVKPLDVGSVFITHIHADHVYGLPTLVHGLMLRDHVFRLFGSAETVDLCRRLLDLFGLRGAKYKTRVEFVVLSSGERTDVGEGVDVTAWNVPHQPASLAFEFRAGPGAKRVVFSGDTPVHPALFEAARGADALVHDCGAPARFFEKYPVLKSVHTSARDLGEWSERAGVRLLAPVHFLTELDFEIGEMEKEIRAHFTGRLFMPSDMDRVVVE
ncbi:MAG TPA: ribonuclease Z [Candidatus Latescibacteria bacterium]|nr:ribonuclease Z [Candidatus Latescibacterota bacterium]